MNITRNLTSLQGLALKGNHVRPGRHEAFGFGSINESDETLTICFLSQNRTQVSPRKWQRYQTYRMVKCQKVYSPSRADFWWSAVEQRIMKLPA